MNECQRITPALRRVALALMALAATVAATGCTAYKGRIVDGETGAPAADVFVLGRYETGGFIVPAHGCGLEVTKSDARGEFALSGGRMAVALYRRGYSERLPKAEGDLYVIVRDETAIDQRLRFLTGLMDRSQCGAQSMAEHKEALRPLYRAIYDEVRAIGLTPQHWRFVVTARRFLQTLNIGMDAAMENARTASWPEIKELQ